MDKNFKSLELDKVLDMLARESSSKDACEKIKNIKPSFNVEEVNKSLKQTYDAHMLIRRFGSPSFGGLENVNVLLKRSQSNGTLMPSELLKIATNLKIFRTLVDWRLKSQSINTDLDDYFKNISPNKYLEEKIFGSIVSEEEISDNASQNLFDIRRKIRSTSLKVREVLDKMIHSQSYKKYLQEPIITIRSERFVLPVKAEYRSEIKGLVHDASASGATVFVEPISVVEINNEIKVLKSRESSEIEKILSDLSREVGTFADSMSLSYANCIDLEVIFSKAHLAYKMRASLPQINEEGVINLKKARHPLIDKDKVVPTDISLGVNFDTLIITGPNTGGKTVSLKTIGILTLMALCGMMIPASDGSEICVFNRVFSDIGDEQSIEQSLSTFSSHMVNIVEIMDKVDEKSLVLLDELGAGTDPVEGAALAISILENLSESGAKIVATTHYAELKEFALKTRRVENGCCEFDIKTLKPTYKLLIGVPGRSNAFAISKRLGMEDHVIARAEELISKDSKKFEEMVKSLEKTRLELEERKNEAYVLNTEAQKLKRQSEELLNKSKIESKRYIESAKVSAANILDKTRIQANSIMDELEGLKKKKSIDTDSKKKLKSQMDDLEKFADPVFKENNKPYKLPRKLKIGDDVLILDIDKKATVLKVYDDGKNVLVQAGIIKTKVMVDNLRLITEKKKSYVGGYKRTVKSNVTKNVNTEIDLRGKNALEAIMELDQFIDSSILSGVNQLTVIHGKGTGVLRKEIQSHLKKHPNVNSYRLGTFGEGEDGVTIVELK